MDIGINHTNPYHCLECYTHGPHQMRYALRYTMPGGGNPHDYEDHFPCRKSMEKFRDAMTPASVPGTMTEFELS